MFFCRSIMPKSTYVRRYGVVHTRDVEFETRKWTKIDLICFNIIIKLKDVNFVCTEEHSDLSSYMYFYSFYALQFGWE